MVSFGTLSSHTDHQKKRSPKIELPLFAPYPSIHSSPPPLCPSFTTLTPALMHPLVLSDPTHSLSPVPHSLLCVPCEELIIVLAQHQGAADCIRQVHQRRGSNVCFDTEVSGVRHCRSAPLLMYNTCVECMIVSVTKERRGMSVL